MNKKIPHEETLLHAAKLSMLNDKPIQLDYYDDPSITIGVYMSGEKIIIKNSDEYTSPINKMYKIKNEYIIETQNSMYITLSCISCIKITEIIPRNVNEHKEELESQ
jgi:hypothetical protein